jgi:hypothetical protein
MNKNLQSSRDRPNNIVTFKSPNPTNLRTNPASYKGNQFNLDGGAGLGFANRLDPTSFSESEALKAAN